MRDAAKYLAMLIPSKVLTINKMISILRVNSYNRFFSFSTDEQMLILHFLSMKLANMLVLLLSYMYILKIYIYIENICIYSHASQVLRKKKKGLL